MSKTIEGWGSDPTPVEVRFWSRVERDEGGDGCWIWIGRVSKNRPYGAIEYEGRLWRPNRFSWFLHNGPIPEGQNVLHTCDNVVCIRPDHLYLGNQSQNLLDMYRRDRRPKRRKKSMEDEE